MHARPEKTRKRKKRADCSDHDCLQASLLLREDGPPGERSPATACVLQEARRRVRHSSVGGNWVFALAGTGRHWLPLTGYSRPRRSLLRGKSCTSMVVGMRGSRGCRRGGVNRAAQCRVVIDIPGEGRESRSRSSAGERVPRQTGRSSERG
ncbi:hypothetical protein J2793_000257 [Paraburkholderia caledonica]|uniref:Uncharacterized protein n=1 Tax=Paraburkholderia caledonica TaxID=134536 RepID=A0AB73I4B8_9BURK|nr:hypothetical protein [Paraburkholderia caledonica]